jgi:hypothetical protein
MGLDMYLDKRTYVRRWDHQKEEEKFLVTVTRGGKPFDAIKLERVSYVIEHVGYWRKANQIHQWFVVNVQGGVDECEDAYVTREQLQELLRVVTEVLADHSKAEKLLPTQSGFFFGGTEYDDGYFADLEDTVGILEAVLKEPNDASFYYQSSW